jgi:nicotinamidase-related amidase
VYVRWWEEFFSEEERNVYQVYQQALREREAAQGVRPALLVIDVTRAFCGEPDQSLEESIRTWPTSCGPEAWKAIRYIQHLVEAARQASLPVIYTTAQPGVDHFYGGVVKRGRGAKESPISRPGAIDIPPEIAPLAEELVLRKPKASAFFATPLLAYLHRQRIDSLIVCGSTTSGCVRATVVDAFSWGFPVYLVEEAVFDRSRISHAVGLFEMNAKYADVMSVDQILKWLVDIAKISKPDTAVSVER